jgi:hypothetical protein
MKQKYKILIILGIIIGIIFLTTFMIQKNCKTLSSPDNSAQIEICNKPYFKYTKIGENDTCTFWNFSNFKGIVEICNEENLQ